MTSKFRTTMTEMITKIEELIKAGNLKRIIINDQNGDKYIEIPIIVGTIFTIAAPIVTIIAIVAGFASNFKVEVITKDKPGDSSVYEVVKSDN